MKIFILLLMGIATYAAGISAYTVYSKCDKPNQAKFILDCIKNANPKSDEEPEDWIYMCKNMSKELYCTHQTYGRYWRNNIFSGSINCECSSCTDVEAVESCKAAGWTK